MQLAQFADRHAEPPDHGRRDLLRLGPQRPPRLRQRDGQAPLDDRAGPDEKRGAGCEQGAREQWKRDLENRKRYSRAQKARRRAAETS